MGIVNILDLMEVLDSVDDWLIKLLVLFSET